MQNKTISKIFEFSYGYLVTLAVLDIIVAQIIHVNPLINLQVPIWSIVIQGGFILCGLFFIAVLTPMLFRTCYINWKNYDDSWIWQLLLSISTPIIGALLTFPLSYLAIFVIMPLVLIIFLLCEIITTIMAAKTRIKSAFFLINFFLMLLPFFLMWIFNISFGFGKFHFHF
jgi:hypothetical protein